VNLVAPRILLIQDDEGAFALTRDLVQRVWGGAATLSWMRSLEQATEAIATGEHDVVLLDQRLGAASGLDFLRGLQSHGVLTPVILLTDSGGYDVDLQAMQAGAADYVVKGDLAPTLLERVVRYAIVRARDQAALRESESRARHMAETAQGLIDSSLDIIVSVDLQRRVVEFNRAAERAFGYARDEIVGQSVDVLYSESADGQRVYDTIRGTGRFEGEIQNRRKDGGTFPATLSATWLTSPAGESIGVMGISRDITAQKETQRRLDDAADLLRRSHDDLLAILNQLTTGVILTDAGRVTFANRACVETLGVEPASVLGRPWLEVFPLDAEGAATVDAMVSRPTELRERVPAQITTRAGRTYWMEIEVRDDPRGPRRRIVFSYDVTAIHDLRRMLAEKAHFRDLVGRSPGMARVFEQIRELAGVETTVLIEGETGTGKELVARAMHSASRRSDKPYVTVNCAGLSETLLGSQLFGHKRGAFTGAIDDQKGIFETADGGAVFLDEIGDISPSVQTTLLRVVQEKEITRLGEVKPRKVDVRILAATHRNLAKEVEAGRFRQDLLYRIRVARIVLPPLRERREDIPLLVEAFLARSRASTGKDVRHVSADAMQKLLAHTWPGNVRELQSAIELAVIHCKGSAVQAGDLPAEIQVPMPATAATAPAGSGIADGAADERERISAALRATRGNRVAAAKRLGISRATLYRRLAELGMEGE
jgi:PAS domain S-box-containing protein